MKIIKSYDVKESFGMGNLSMDEMLNIDGGEKTIGDICLGNYSCFLKNPTKEELLEYLKKLFGLNKK